MNTIDTHKSPGLNERIMVELGDEPDADKIHYRYNFFIKDLGGQWTKLNSSFVFQKGPLLDKDGKELGANGLSEEAVLAVLIDRLQRLNAKLPCRENSIAITHLEDALHWLHHRTADRVKRRVEGTMEK